MKFVHEPSDRRKAAKTLLSALRKELPKIRKLIEKGASAYYLVTNVQGTGHIESGSIDKVNSLLKGLGIPARALWRDDLSRKLDSEQEIKLRYSEVLSGPDYLSLLSEMLPAEERERRKRTIRAFLKTQYERDQQVRFRQVELENSLLRLFVDVPARYEQHDAPETDELATYMKKRFAGDDAKAPEGALAMLLDPQVQALLPIMVLEGAPGQGKSTVTQFLCQVHRMGLLDKPEWEQLPAYQRPRRKLLPIRCEFRQFATWQSKQHPFGRPDEPLPTQWDWTDSLESFLAALISDTTGGDRFTVSDLRAVAEQADLLLVLDGFDEVADAGQRERLVTRVHEGLIRLQPAAADGERLLQVVITSRPPAFSHSPGFRRHYPHLSLDPLTRPLIDQYTANWLTVNNLAESSEGREIKGVLDEKLEQPHVAELAKNAMQLAILLSLIRKKGASLPQKRTALYRDYVEIFFDREVEKTPLLREYRELVHNLHGCLGYHLQT